MASMGGATAAEMVEKYHQRPIQAGGPWPNLAAPETADAVSATPPTSPLAAGQRVTRPEGSRGLAAICIDG